MKTIDTLVQDIYDVIEGKGGWDATITSFMAEGIANIAEDRFSKPQEPRDYLSPSMLGHTCDRKKWYKVNQPDKAEPINANGLGTFFYGDILEYVVIALAIAAGHTVTGLQEELDVCGLKGKGDCVIDGMVIDVKSANGRGFVKFKNNGLRDDDPFAYISQLSSYLYGYQADPTVTNNTHAGFLAVNKERFQLALDIYDLTEEVRGKEAEVKRNVEMVAGPMPSERLPDVPDGKSGNMTLSLTCKYCEFKHHCWGDKLRLFLYKGGPRYLTQVARTPDVPEGKV